MRSIVKFALVLTLTSVVIGCGGGGGGSGSGSGVPTPPTASPVPTPQPVNYLPIAQSSPGNQYSFESQSNANFNWTGFGYSAAPLDASKNSTQASLAACAQASGVYPIFDGLGFFTLVGDDTTGMGLATYLVSRSIATGDIVVYAMFPASGGTACVQSMILAKASMKSGDSWTMKNSFTGVTHTAFVATDHLTRSFTVGGLGPHGGMSYTYAGTSRVQYDSSMTAATWAANIGPVELQYFDPSTSFQRDYILYAYTITSDSK